jgi:hypothetical protein
MTPAEKHGLVRAEAERLLVETTPHATSREIFRAQDAGSSMQRALKGGVTSTYELTLGQSSRKIGGEPAPIPPLPNGKDNAARNAEDRLGQAIGATSLDERLRKTKPFEPKMMT